VDPIDLFGVACSCIKIVTASPLLVNIPMVKKLLSEGAEAKEMYISEQWIFELATIPIYEEVLKLDRTKKD
jgi:hypothetical protein